MPYSNGLNRNIVQCLNDFNIPLYLSHTVTNVIGKEKLERIELSKVDEHFTPIKGSEQYFDVDVLLLSIGLTPVTDLLTKLGIAIHPRTKGPIVNEHNETSVKGVFVAGNGLHVHDLVDFVSNEARLASQGAYAYLNNKLHYDNEVIKTEAKVGIGYVVPQIINYLNVEDKVTLKFRATKPFQNVDIIIKADDEIIKKVYKMNLIPSEMENIEISRELFNDNTKVISVEVKER